MNRRWFPYLAVVLLLALLAVLATLQYQWLGQISDAESVRLSKRLIDDTNRFAGDFNREIQKAYFSFQADAAEFEKGDFRALKKRYLFWRQQSIDPDLIEGIYFVGAGNTEEIRKFDLDSASLTLSSWPDSLSAARTRINKELKAMAIEGDALLMPVFKEGPDFTRLVLTRKEGQPDSVDQEEHISVPAIYGVLIIQLDREVIRTSILPKLTEKYFPRDGSGSFELSISDQQGRPVYLSTNEHFEDGDASAGLFSLQVNDFAFFSKSLGNQVIDHQIKRRSGVILSESITERTITNEDGKEIDVKILGPEKKSPVISIREVKELHTEGAWKLYVRHSSGSLDQFVAETRIRNLGIGFGILGILAAGMVLIVISSQRARALANRQLEFVSSVSHEFRTPLSVIYSAGENISDGVIGGSEKLADYGNLIKREGRKLSAMVEQILEYAGANSTKRKYEFRSIDVGTLIESMLDEYQPMIEEEGFELERDIAPALPLINADAGALQRALQNLIANSLKYSDVKKWICVSARNGGGEVSISVKDRGIGISKNDQAHIFEPFFRSRSVVDDQISGNGLGLSLVKQIVDAHGGSVSVISEEGAGTEFVITIPTADPKSL